MLAASAGDPGVPVSMSKGGGRQVGGRMGVMDENDGNIAISGVLRGEGGRGVVYQHPPQGWALQLLPGVWARLVKIE